MKQIVRIALLTSVFAIIPSLQGTIFQDPVAKAGEIAFPWHSSTPAPIGRVPARVLPKTATTPIEVLSPSKQAYPYGWFGPKPTTQWKRSFGSSRNYTQWSTSFTP